ncbi:unnamed protein product [Wuchereria bancrofti]|uniref:Uncharacterized protein n=1 Tax=Wuchereria bancrofti TaxID=6293 RepID=A0A3P7DW68_WUCBA|nr:unnamed protein product [Wuchereria bancrofti]
MEIQIKMNPSKRRSLFSNESVQLEPASSHLATAMYPPRRTDLLISSKAQLHNRVSQDVGEELPTFAHQQQQPIALIGNGPISSLMSGRQFVNHIGALDEKRRTSNSGPNQILMLQEALKHSLASTKQQLIQTNETLDGMRGQIISINR